MRRRETPPLACLLYKIDFRYNFVIAKGSLRRYAASPLHPFLPLNFSSVMAFKSSRSQVL